MSYFPRLFGRIFDAFDGTTFFLSSVMQSFSISCPHPPLELTPIGVTHTSLPAHITGCDVPLFDIDGPQMS